MKSEEKYTKIHLNRMLANLHRYIKECIVIHIYIHTYNLYKNTVCKCKFILKRFSRKTNKKKIKWNEKVKEKKNYKNTSQSYTCRFTQIH